MKPRSRVRCRVLFITVGSTRFDKLISKILSATSLSNIIDLGFTKMVLQVGQSAYDRSEFDEFKSSLKQRIELDLYEYKASIAEDIERADVIVGHAGAGTCLEVLRANKRLLIVANDSLMDNHQDELANQLASDNHAIKTTIENLDQDLLRICDNKLSLKEFPQKDASKFEGIFNEALERATARL